MCRLQHYSSDLVDKPRTAPPGGYGLDVPPLLLAISANINVTDMNSGDSERPNDGDEESCAVYASITNTRRDMTILSMPMDSEHPILFAIDNI